MSPDSDLNLAKKQKQKKREPFRPCTANPLARAADPLLVTSSCSVMFRLPTAVLGGTVAGGDRGRPLPHRAMKKPIHHWLKRNCISGLSFFSRVSFSPSPESGAVVLKPSRVSVECGSNMTERMLIALQQAFGGRQTCDLLKQ